MPNLAVKTAVCQCDKGAKPSTLIAAVVPGVQVCGQTVATIADVLFPPVPFGVCAVTQKACAYAPAAPWANIAPSVAFGAQPPLVQGAALPCVIGGIIHVISVSQGTVDAGKEPPAGANLSREAWKSFLIGTSEEVIGAKYDLVEREVGKLPDTDSNKNVKKYVGGGAKALGKASGGIGLAMDVHEIATSEGEARERAIGGAVGGVAGGAIGGTIGSVVPGPGTAVGAVVGSTVGTVVGNAVAPTVADGLDKAGDIAGGIKDSIFGD